MAQVLLSGSQLKTFYHRQTISLTFYWILFLQQKHNKPKNLKKCLKSRFTSTFELTFLCNYRFDFVYWDLNQKLTLVVHDLFEKIQNWTLNQNLDSPSFRKTSMNIDKTPFSNSTYYVTTGLTFFSSSQRTILQLLMWIWLKNQLLWHLHGNLDNPKLQSVLLLLT